MLTANQKGRLAKDREFEQEKDQHHSVPAVKINVGDTIEFKETPEFNGKVYKISNDAWKMIHIDYGVPGRAKIIPPSEMKILLEKGLATVTPAPIPEKSAKTLKKIQEELKNK